MSRVFDHQELLDRIDGDWDFLAEIVAMLASDGRALMVEIRRAADAGDAAALSRAGHALKGMVSNFCSPTTQAGAFEVEKIGKSGDLSESAAAISTLAAQVEVLIAELMSFLDERHSCGS